MTPEAFARETGVSRETCDRLERYAALLVKWQKAVNLVGASTLPDLWRRHMLDCAQLYPFIPAQAGTLIDLGSGAGFPGLVLAIMARERASALSVHLVESDRKKATFLREAARAAEVAPIIHAARIEAIQAFPADIITARALAPMSQIVAWSAKFWSQDTVGLFLKGQDIDSELTPPGDFETMEIRQHQSSSDPKGRILELRRRRFSEGDNA
jgi:16S rRNA (guanine527-N7)-methyltransferase